MPFSPVNAAGPRKRDGGRERPERETHRNRTPSREMRYDMAARLNPRHQDMVRDKIQASQLINRLTQHALGNVELSATQVKAIEILLKKSVPDLSAVSISGTGDNGELQVQIVRYGTGNAA